MKKPPQSGAATFEVSRLSPTEAHRLRNLIIAAGHRCKLSIYSNGVSLHIEPAAVPLQVGLDAVQAHKGAGGERVAGAGDQKK